jgi:hypothetical protein
MASLVSLPNELKLNIIENLDLYSTSFIPAPSQELLSLSRVCRVLRGLVLPFMLKTITLLNEEKSGSSVLAILNSPYREHIQHVHYIGVMPMPEAAMTRSQPVKQPSAEDLPESVEQVLSNLGKLPNLERTVVDFRCGKNDEDDSEFYEHSFEDFDDPEDDNDILEEEKAVAYRSLMERSYRALACNPSSTIKHLELKNVSAKKCSAWNLPEFLSLLEGLTSFTMSLRGGENGAGWHINMAQGYLDFIEDLDDCFFQHLSNVKNFEFAASEDSPPGIPDGLNNAALRLLEEHMPQLQNLTLQHVFISSDLAAFVTAHGKTLESVQLTECYSGCGQEDELSWSQFFRNIASKDMESLRAFDIAPTDLERLQDDEDVHWKQDTKKRSQELHQQFPERRMFDYKHLDDKYGMVFDNEDEAFGRFEDGSDHTSWDEFCKVIKKNVGNDS